MGEVQLSRRNIRWLKLGLCALSSLVLLPPKANGQATVDPPFPAPTSVEVKRWIVELGADEYTVRKAAADRLKEGGAVARAALDDVVNAPDPEIRAAARRLVAFIDEHEFNHRLAKFAADVDGRDGINLPGWQEFRRLVGRDKAARSLFVEMQREESVLLQRVFESPTKNNEIGWEEELGARMNWRILSRQNGLTSPLGSNATMLFLGALPTANLPDNAASSLAQLAQMPPIGTALTDKRPDNAVRRLLVAWIVHCPNRNEQILQQRLNLMLQHQLAEAISLPLQIVQRVPNYVTLHPSHRVMAILAVGKFGSAKDALALEPLLDDLSDYLPAPKTNGPQEYQHGVQVRDVALATMLHLTNQEPVTYGFLHVRPHPQTIFDATSLGMENNDVRDAAAKRWRFWREQRNL